MGFRDIEFTFVRAAWAFGESFNPAAHSQMFARRKHFLLTTSSEIPEEIASLWLQFL